METAGLIPPSCSHIPYTIIQCGRHFFPNTMPPPRAPAAKQAPTSLPLAACCPSRSSSLSPHCPCGRYKKPTPLGLPACSSHSTGPLGLLSPCAFLLLPPMHRQDSRKSLVESEKENKNSHPWNSPLRISFVTPFLLPCSSPSLSPCVPNTPKTAASSLGSWRRRIRNP